MTISSKLNQKALVIVTVAARGPRSEVRASVSVALGRRDDAIPPAFARSYSQQRAWSARIAPIVTSPRDSPACSHSSAVSALSNTVPTDPDTFSRCKAVLESTMHSAYRRTIRLSPSIPQASASHTPAVIVSAFHHRPTSAIPGAPQPEPVRGAPRH